MKHSTNLWLLLVLTAAPVLGGWLFYLNPQWLPESRANHGDLVSPAIGMGETELNDREGKVVTLGAEGRWWMLIPAASCGEACRKELWKTRQVRLALGQGRRKVERLLLLESGPSSHLGKWLQSKHPALRVAVVPATKRRSIWRKLASAGESYRDRLHVVDPMGNLMMRYPADTAGEAVLEDFQRLLKVSEHWSDYAGH